MSEITSETTPLYILDPHNRFSDRVGDYVKNRPSYPEALIDEILLEFGSSQILAADIGAGTGISSRQLAEKGVRVIAIEPNLAMQEASQAHPLIEFRDGNAQETQLADKSVDLVTAFQAFHWFNHEPSLLEFRRILKPAGRLAVVWNNRNRDDGFTGGYSRLIKEISNKHPAESRKILAEPLLESPHFANVREYWFENQQELDLPGLIGRAMSVSYLPREGEGYEKLIAGLSDLYHQYQDERGLVYMLYRTSLHIAEPTL